MTRSLVATTVAFIVLVIGAVMPSVERPITLHAWTEYPYVAHALGGSLEGDKHTDTREAMIESYQFGFRAFEADVVLLADGTALVAHNHFEPYYGLDKTFPEATWEEVQELRYRGREGQLDLPSTVMRASDLVQWMEANPDVWMHLDTKAGPERNFRVLEAFAEFANPEVLDRMIPFVEDQAELDRAFEVWDWSGYLFAMYRSGLSIKEVELILDANPRGGLLSSAKRLDASIRGLGVPLFVHGTSGVDEAVALVNDGMNVYVKNWIGDEFQLIRDLAA